MIDGPSRVYLDTNAFIYAIQAASDASAPVLHLLAEMTRLNRKPVTSELTLAELLCKKDLTPQLQADYMDLLVESEAIQLEPVTRTILLSSADIRRSGGALKLQDAIHVATAMNAGCTYIVTNDLGMRTTLQGLTAMRPTEVNVAHILSALHV